MGDRGNIFFVDGELDDETLAGIYMYTHWGASALPATVMAALDHGRSRWGDSQYFGRILFCRLIEYDVDGTTGYGLSTRLWDNEHLVIRVDDRNCTVSYHEPGTEMDPSDDGLWGWSYEEFCDELDPDEAQAKFLRRG